MLLLQKVNFHPIFQCYLIIGHHGKVCFAPKISIEVANWVWALMHESDTGLL